MRKLIFYMAVCLCLAALIGLRIKDANEQVSGCIPKEQAMEASRAMEQQFRLLSDDEVSLAAYALRMKGINVTVESVVTEYMTNPDIARVDTVIE